MSEIKENNFCCLVILSLFCPYKFALKCKYTLTVFLHYHYSDERLAVMNGNIFIVRLVLSQAHQISFLLPIHQLSNNHVELKPVT